MNLHDRGIVVADKILPTVPPTLPTHLAKAPIIEGTFEIRFNPAQPAVAQLLPGLVFAKLGGKYGRAEATPIASIPPQVREIDPNLRYQAEYRVSGETAAVFMGDRVAGVSVPAPYEGWQNFRPRVLEFLELLQGSQLVRAVERFSLKFTNVIPAPPEPQRQLDLLNLKVEIGGIKPNENGFRFRTEINDERIIRIVELATNAEVQILGGKASGLLLSLDCIRQIGGEEFWPNHLKSIDDLHVQLKELFFGLITENTLQSLGPVYEAHRWN